MVRLVYLGQWLKKFAGGRVPVVLVVIFGLPFLVFCTVLMGCTDFSTNFFDRGAELIFYASVTVVSVLGLVIVVSSQKMRQRAGGVPLMLGLILFIEVVGELVWFMVQFCYGG